MVFLPPRHGKSTLISEHLPAWYLLRHPDRRVILAGYGAQFASTWGRRAREIMREYGPAFGVALADDQSAADSWEIVGSKGGMRTAGVGGPLTGFGADLMVVDDAVKTAEEAYSSTYREKVWDWWRAVAYTRLEPGGSAIVVMTRWHLDDLAGRILAHERDRWRVVSLPAIAEDNDPLGRAHGEPLWPDRFPLAELDKIKQTLGSHWFNALYQQRPVVREGALFRREWFRFVDSPGPISRPVRWWDFAGTAPRAGSDPDYTVGLLVGRDEHGRVTVADMVRTRDTPHAVETLVRQTADRDGRSVEVWIGQEPGSSGLAVIDHYRRDVLPGYVVRGARETGPKELRAEAVAAQAEAGNVQVVRAEWTGIFVGEVCDFPFAAHDDIVDCLSGAYSVLGQTEAFATGATKPIAGESGGREELLSRLNGAFGRRGRRSVGAGMGRRSIR